MKVAIVHDWLVVYAGAERCLEQILNIYPEADLFALVDFLDEDKRNFIKHKKVTTSFIQHLPKAKTKYRSYLPLMPLAIEQLDLSKYDLIISSSHCVAKGIITGPDQVHISYVYSPIRYAWDLQHQYLKESGLNKGIKGFIAKIILHYMRLWDIRTSNNVDHFIAISKFIKKRIWKCYRREADVIYPPVDVEAFEYCDQKEDFYLTASRMVPYKKMDLIVEAFTQMSDKKLIVIGTGPDFDKIQKIAQGHDNIKLMGYQPFSVLKEHMQKAKAFVFAAEEDFGITPVEAQACGTPVIAYGKGGALETVRGLENQNNPTGVFFYKQDKESLIKAINYFENNLEKIQIEDCRKNALNFGIDKFKKDLEEYISNRFYGIDKDEKNIY
ncbi:glycosyltransferase family 4 protein [Megamonas rupellensis]|uniref:glycosyltransferase family 4 protein n=1 Tax=Megamonas rupellensis TaxID=491921 RepID=UPI00195E4BC0|nr:glycosyltransferase family 4 protein [Megamonas rupellensis]MBM6748734.1 glycosyltransferase family 4 protein [Megamonas rupellensis]